jgi:hypothetical protein
MESVGNEKKIQALFRELKLADERVAPEFIKVWDRAEATSPRGTSPGSPRLFNPSFGLAMVTLLVIILSSLLLWLRNGQRSEQVDPKIATESETPGSTTAPLRPTPPPTPPIQSVLARSPVPIKSNQWARKLAARRKADLDARHAVIREAVSISSWQSPTATLMQSPVDHVLTSLPQLDRSLNELKTFLPNTSQ